MYTSFQLTHLTRDDHAVESSEQWQLKGDKKYYSAHNFITRLIFGA